MNNLHDSNTTEFYVYPGRGISVAFLGLLQLLAGGVLLHVCLNAGDLTGALSAAVLLAVGGWFIYVGYSGSRRKRNSGRLSLTDDRIVMQSETDGIKTVFWSSVLKISLYQAALKQRFLDRITIVYRDHTCGMSKGETGQELSEVKLLIIPLVTFKRPREIVQRIEYIARELGVALETGNSDDLCTVKPGTK